MRRKTPSSAMPCMRRVKSGEGAISRASARVSSANRRSFCRWRRARAPAGNDFQISSAGLPVLTKTSPPGDTPASGSPWAKAERSCSATRSTWPSSQCKRTCSSATVRK